MSYLAPLMKIIKYGRLHLFITLKSNTCVEHLKNYVGYE